MKIHFREVQSSVRGPNVQGTLVIQFATLLDLANAHFVFVPHTGIYLFVTSSTRKGRALTGATFPAPAEGWWPSATLGPTAPNHFFLSFILLLRPPALRKSWKGRAR